MNRLKLLAAASLSALVLSACGGDKNLASKDPAQAAKDLAIALHDNDFERLSHISVTPEDYTKLEQRAADEAKNAPAPTAEQNKQFAEQMAKFTAPDAEDKLFAEIQPKLAQMGPQIPMGVAMVSGMAGQAIDSSDKLGPDDKATAKTILTAVTKWATTAPFADQEKAKQAIHIVVTTARDLKLTSFDTAEKMSFNERAQKTGVAFGGMQKLLAVYGFDTAQALDSVKAEKKSENGDNAVVTINATLLGSPVKFDVDMVKRDDRWYLASLLKQAEDSLAKPASPAAPVEVAPAPEQPAPTTEAPASEPTSEPGAPASDASVATDAASSGG